MVHLVLMALQIAISKDRCRYHWDNLERTQCMLVVGPVLNTIDFPTLIGYNTMRTFSQPPVEYHRPVCTLTNDLKRNYISNIDDCVLREHQIGN